MYRYRNYGIKKVETPGERITKEELEKFRAEAENSIVQTTRISNLPLDEVINRGIERSKKANRKIFENIGREL